MLWTQAYRLRLKRDLDQWVEQGLITPANADKISASLRTSPDTRKLPGLLTMMGATLLICAVLTFIGANWNEIAKSVKLALIFGGMWATYGASAWLMRRDHPAFAQAAVLLGLGLFGSGIMLIAQIYHIETDDPGGLLAWCIAAIACGWALPSRPALALGLGLAVIWSGFASQQTGAGIHWAFFLPWAAGAVLAFRLRWSSGFHLIIIAVLAWIVINSESLGDALGGFQNLAAVMTLLAVAAWLAPIALAAHWIRFTSVTEKYGTLIAFIAFSILQLDDTPPSPTTSWFIAAIILAAVTAALAAQALSKKVITPKELATPVALALGALLYPMASAMMPASMLLVYATALLALSVGLVAYGLARQSRFDVNLGFWAFGLEVLYLYFETLGTLLGTSAFFALGGVILIAGGIFMERLRRRLVETASKGAAA